ncbi:MAG: hypothetical protein KGH67_01825 [Candidatus Micrarchaeota archaeon]|nr:hypothetical protein [Candidatus Micrarchaeota archaeon]MDE1859244.1 hypothetical protein [Candidatus Micrarchaeota archaeon]
MVLEQGTRKTITQTDFKRIKAECQKAIDTEYNKNKGFYHKPGTSGFAWIRFSGVATKNQLEKAGFKISKAHPTGYVIVVNLNSLYEIQPGLTQEGKAAYWQSINLKEAVAEKAAKILKEEFGIDCWAGSGLD